MDITIIQVLQHFLKEYQTHLKEHRPRLNSFFSGYFTRSELINIINFNYGAEYLSSSRIGDYDNSDLMKLIISDYQILDYYMTEAARFRRCNEVLSQENISSFLGQIGLQNHYLCMKSIDTWDSYDHSNYNAIRIKYGRAQRTYGIYNMDISQDQVLSVTSPPPRFFETWAKANRLIKELDIIDSHVLELIQST